MRETQLRLVTIMFVQVTETTENEREIPIVSCRLEQHQKLLRGLLKRFHGELLEIRVGELYAYFPGAELAFNAAISLQEMMSQFHMRIGLHVGEVLFKEGKLLGSAVNLASRLPSCARAGGICLSRTVYQYLRERERQMLVALGPHDLKNFDIRMPLYAYFPDGQAGRSRGREMKRQYIAGLKQYWQTRTAKYALLGSFTGFVVVFIWAQNMFFDKPTPDVIHLFVPAFVNQAQNDEGNIHLKGIEMAVRSRLSGAHDGFDLVLMNDRDSATAELLVKQRQVSGNINTEYTLSSLPVGFILASGRVEQDDSSLFHLQDELSDFVLQDLHKLHMTTIEVPNTLETKITGTKLKRH
jgi:class 3 adenylate cyclase